MVFCYQLTLHPQQLDTQARPGMRQRGPLKLSGSIIIYIYNYIYIRTMWPPPRDVNVGLDSPQ